MAPGIGGRLQRRMPRVDKLLRFRQELLCGTLLNSIVVIDRLSDHGVGSRHLISSRYFRSAWSRWGRDRFRFGRRRFRTLRAFQCIGADAETVLQCIDCFDAHTHGHFTGIAVFL